MMTGHFTGWVEESVRQKLGLATSAAVRDPGSSVVLLWPTHTDLKALATRAW